MREIALLILVGFLLFVGYILVQAFLTHRWASKRIALADRVREKVKQGIWDDEVIAWNAEHFGLPEEVFTRAYEAGVKVAFGTDSGVSAHGDNAQEFRYMVEGGMTPLEAIQAAC